MRKTVLLGALIVVAVSSSFCFANNLAIANVSLTNHDAVNHNTDIQFDISWDNSWFDSGAPSATANWDAAWVFAKFSKYSAGTWGNWTHCTLLSTGTVAAAGAQIVLGTTSTVYKGAFIYRSAAGTGSNSWTANALRWSYGADGLADTDTVKIKLFGIEMVYVSSGVFSVGDTANGVSGGLYAGNSGAPRQPYQVTSEGAITVADTTGNLYYDVPNGGNNGDRSGPIPAAFPKGVNAFYLMKYEISQRQYCEFLNTLTAAQQNARVDSGLEFNNYRNFIKKTNTSPAFFGVDANNNAGLATAADKTKLNESADGGGVACNYLSSMDEEAYAAWAALRPMTELEFEKAARGPNLAVTGEYAWGDAVLDSYTSSLSNAGTVSEAPNQGNANVSGASPQGPYRVGSYANATSTRHNAGAGYYGAMELSGNLWERPVTIGAAGGRSFTGTHGSGTLSANGNATNSDWPGYSSGEVSANTGVGFRGGSWNFGNSNAQVADRYDAAFLHTDRFIDYGGRCARTAP